MIKLVACDLDGTLFNSDMSVSEANIQAVKNAQDNGIEFLIATGRAPHESRAILKDAGLHTGFINLNGALVFDEDSKLMVKHKIPTYKALEIVELLHQAGFYFEIITADQVYTEDLNQRISNVAHLMVDLNPLLDFKQAVAISAGNKTIMNMKQVDHFEDLLHNPEVEVMKIIAFDSRGHEAFDNVKKEVAQIGDLVVTSSSSSNIEINAQQAQKGIALLDYAKLKNIKRDEIAAIGDNLNDESMIREAGIGVAIGNAVPVIKGLAQITTKTNNEDGVAYILNQFVKENKQDQR
ncbi:Cof-type HAD-IIB family hydrolase [Lactobacillus helveticus]|uniref:Cof-type HAD-IIB family hydrolase n=1 Tax=Lactobacillus helveticus TaxID=1587 RepID=UPI0003E943BF|nr:Cof-type HAD-IIB family hydrolase [Lactobacillus helveticus]AHI11617.1 Phosphoserine phosphatase [Lactobacillus helveticus H9]NRO08281.1 Phosphatase YwpJ [Lactobacillus helveticus]NRO40674.1 Phosphatase YwpJ [Lactobacillus helveticus]NRO46828.1 Phosphatase YwpJ [Lactobacillus helveticus]NRO56139.1 Phosphatase YwpJ [Lactobacillus helveticus]